MSHRTPPVLFAIDADAGVVRALRDDLNRRFGEDFLVIGESSARSGLATRDGSSPWPLERAPLPLETSMPGVFAAGDVRYRSIKRVASAVGDGATVVRLVHEYLAALSVAVP